ncbi:MAG: T9SS type A sorting domain-containing protein [Candidatus Delongbacteria bacterium]
MQRLVLCFVLILGLALGSAQAQEGQFCALTGASEGACRAVASNWNTVLIGAGTQLSILHHLHAPQDTLLRQVSLHFPDLVLGVALDDTLAYVAAGRGLYLYGMSDPGEPRLLSVLDVGDTVRDVVVDGDRAYLAANFAGLCIVDVSDPVHPLRLGTLPSLEAQAVALQGQLAYLADREAGLRVIDVSDPALPRQTGHLPSLDKTLDVIVRDSLAFVADGSAGLRVVNLSSGTPTPLGRYNTRGYAGGLALLDSMVYVADGDSGLCLVSVLFPQWPHELGFVDTPGFATALCLEGTLAYLADDGGGLRVLELGNPAFAAEVDRYDAPGYAHGLSRQGSQALVADALGGQISLVELGPWEDLPTLASFTPLVPSWNVSWDGALAVTAADTAGLRVLDLVDPLQLSELGFLDDDVNAEWQAARLVDGVVHALLYVPATLQDPEFSVWVAIDLADPADPQVLGLLELPGHAYDITVVDNLDYVACGEIGLVILEAGAPAFAAVLGYLPTPGVAHAVAVEGGLACVADGLVGQLRVVDVTDPELPAVLGVFQTGTWVVDVALQDSMAFVAAYDLGLRVVDLRDPSLPVERGFLDTPGHALELELDGDVVYLADSEGGLARIGFDRVAAAVGDAPAQPRAFALGEAVPNPFNPRTSLPFTLAAPEHVSLTIYDLLGREVRRLVNGPLPAGAHQVTLDAEGLASGVYVARLTTPQGSESRKLLLLK